MHQELEQGRSWAQMTRELLHAHGSGLPALPGGICAYTVASSWTVDTCELSSVFPPGTEPGGGWEQVVLGSLLARGLLRKCVQPSWKRLWDSPVLLPSSQALPLWGSGHTKRPFPISIALAVLPVSSPGAWGQGQVPGAGPAAQRCVEAWSACSSFLLKTAVPSPRGRAPLSHPPCCLWDSSDGQCLASGTCRPGFKSRFCHLPAGSILTSTASSWSPVSSSGKWKK